MIRFTFKILINRDKDTRLEIIIVKIVALESSWNFTIINNIDKINL